METDRAPMERDGLPAEAEPTLRGVQFSLGSMVILITAASVALAGLFGGPARVAIATLYLLFSVWPTALVVVLLYGRGWARTFSIGALVPSAPPLVTMSTSFLAMGYGAYGPLDKEDRLVLVGVFLVMLTASLLCGIAAMFVRRMVEFSLRHDEPIADDGDDAMEKTGRST